MFKAAKNLVVVAGVFSMALVASAASAGSTSTNYNEIKPWKASYNEIKPWKAGYNEIKPWKTSYNEIKPWKTSYNEIKPWKAN
jgi:hypothetical protein